MNGTQTKHLTPTTVRELVSLPEHAFALEVTMAVMQHSAEQIAQVERAVHARVKLRPPFQSLLTVPGIGQTLANDHARDERDWPTLHRGSVYSYCRCVESTKLNNGNRKGQGNTKSDKPKCELGF